MRIPRDLSAATLVRGLGKLGYSQDRQTGSHIRLTTTRRGEHHVTIPNHDPLRMGTLAVILSSVAAHHGMTRDQVLRQVLD